MDYIPCARIFESYKMTYTVKQLLEAASNFKAASEFAHEKTKAAEDLEEKHDGDKSKVSIIRTAHDEAHAAHKVAAHAHHAEIHRLKNEAISEVNKLHSMATTQDKNSTNRDWRRNNMEDRRDATDSAISRIIDHSNEANYHLSHAADHKRSSETI